MDSEVSDIFLTRTRNGRGSLQVRMEGFGNLASAEIRGGSERRSGKEPENFWNRLFVFEAAPSLVNWCCRRAYVS